MAARIRAIQKRFRSGFCLKKVRKNGCLKLTKATSKNGRVNRWHGSIATISTCAPKAWLSPINSGWKECLVCQFIDRSTSKQARGASADRNRNNQSCTAQIIKVSLLWLEKQYTKIWFMTVQLPWSLRLYGKILLEETKILLKTELQVSRWKKAELSRWPKPVLSL